MSRALRARLNRSRVAASRNADASTAAVTGSRRGAFFAAESAEVLSRTIVCCPPWSGAATEMDRFRARMVASMEAQWVGLRSLCTRDAPTCSGDGL